MTTARGSALAAGLSAVAVLSGCAGLGLPPAAPVDAGTSTPPAAAAPTTTPAPSASTAPAAPTETPATSAPPATASPTSEPVSPTETPTQAPTGSPSPESDTVARMEGGNGSATPLLLETSALASGWRATTARDTRGYRMTVCGVDLEPTEPVDSAQQNWQKGAGGPYLERHVRVYPDATATKVVAALAQKMPRCTGYTAKDAKGKSTFTVEKLNVEGAPSGTVAWRQRVPLVVPVAATGTASPTTTTVEVIQDVAVRRVGAAVVLTNSYAVETDPDAEALAASLRSTD